MHLIMHGTSEIEEECVVLESRLALDEGIRGSSVL